MLKERGSPLEESVAIAESYANMLELHVLHHQTSVGAKGFTSDVVKFRARLQW